jgi:hypothetical protein
VHVVPPSFGVQLNALYPALSGGPVRLACDLLPLVSGWAHSPFDPPSLEADRGVLLTVIAVLRVYHSEYPAPRAGD